MAGREISDSAQAQTSQMMLLAANALEMVNDQFNPFGFRSSPAAASPSSASLASAWASQSPNDEELARCRELFGELNKPYALMLPQGSPEWYRQRNVISPGSDFDQFTRGLQAIRRQGTGREAVGAMLDDILKQPDQNMQNTAHTLPFISRHVLALFLAQISFEVTIDMGESHNLGPERAVAAVTRYLDTPGVRDRLRERILSSLRRYITRRSVGLKAIITDHILPLHHKLPSYRLNDVASRISRGHLMRDYTYTNKQRSFNMNGYVNIWGAHTNDILTTLGNTLRRRRELDELARATSVTPDMLFRRGQGRPPELLPYQRLAVQNMAESGGLMPYPYSPPLPMGAGKTMAAINLINTMQNFNRLQPQIIIGGSLVNNSSSEDDEESKDAECKSSSSDEVVIEDLQRVTSLDIECTSPRTEFPGPESDDKESYLIAGGRKIYPSSLSSEEDDESSSESDSDGGDIVQQLCQSASSSEDDDESDSESDDDDIIQQLCQNASSSEEKDEPPANRAQNTSLPALSILMGSAVAREGIDLSTVRRRPPVPNNFNNTYMQQALGRAIRCRSHLGEQEMRGHVIAAEAAAREAAAREAAAREAARQPNERISYRMVSYRSFAQRIGGQPQQNRIIVDEAHNVITEPVHVAEEGYDARRLRRELEQRGVDHETIRERLATQTQQRLNEYDVSARQNEAKQLMTSLVRKTCRDKVREIVDKDRVQRAFKDAIADLFGENDSQREREEIQKILHRWNTEQSVKSREAQVRMEQEAIRSETEWGGLDRICLDFSPEKEARREYPKDIEYAQQRGLSAAQVLSLMPDDAALNAFLNSEMVTMPLYAGRAWWMQSLAATIRCLTHRLANGSLTCGKRLFSKLIELLPPTPTPAMLEVLPELADEYKSILDACKFYINQDNMNQLYNFSGKTRKYTMQQYFQLKRVFAKMLPEPEWFFAENQFLPSYQTHNLRQYDPKIYDQIALVRLHSLDLWYLVDVLLPEWDVSEVLHRLFSKEPVSRSLCWIPIVKAVKMVRLEERKEAAVAAVVWLNSVSRAIAASNFWADETCRSGELLDLIAEQGPIDENPNYGTIAYNLTQAPPSPSFVVWLIRSCNKIAPNIARFCLPSYRDLLLENGNKLDLTGLQMLQEAVIDRDSYNKSNAMLDWMLLAKNTSMISNLPRWRVDMMIELWSHLDKTMSATFIAHGYLLVGYASYGQLEKILTQITMLQRAALMSAALDTCSAFAISRLNSYDNRFSSVSYRKFIVEYLLGEIAAGVQFTLNGMLNLAFSNNKGLKEAAILAVRKEWGGIFSSSTLLQLQKQPFWLQLHLEGSYKTPPSRLPFVANKTHTWEGDSPLDVAEEALGDDMRSVNTWTFINGNGSDLGGISRDFYASAGDEIRESVMELRDGYLVPKAGTRLQQLRVVGALMSRSVFVDLHCMGLELHPALLMYLVCKGYDERWQSLENAPWSATYKLLGDEWCKLLAPLATQRAARNPPPNSCEFWTEMRVHFRNIHVEISAIVDGWWIYDKGVQVYSPMVLDTTLRGDRSCDVDKLFGRLTVVNGVDDGDGEFDDGPYENLESEEAKNLREDIYRASIEAILRRWSLEKRRELYRFWFGTEQPNLAVGDRPYIYIYRNQGREYAVSHTCSNTMELTWIDSFDPEEIERRVERMLDLSIGNQRVAREAGHLFQIA
jgi:hypothetical protein